MGTWGYRIVKLPPSKDDKRKDEGKDKLVPHYGICECYYNEDGSVWSRSIEPETIEAWEEDEGDDGPKEIIKTLEMMLADAKKYPVFEDPEKWPKPDHEPTETGCCIGAAFPLVIKGWIKKVKNKAKQVTNDLR